MHRQSEIKMARLSFRSHFHRDPDLSTGRAGIKGNSTVKKKITAVWTVRGPEQTLQVFFLFFFQRSTLGFCLPRLQDSSLTHIAPTGALRHLQPALLWIFALLGDDVLG